MAKNGSTRCCFGQKRMYVPENNSGRECCWPYLIGQHPLSPVFGQKRPGTPGNSYFAQLPPVFGHFLFRFGPYDVPFRSATRPLEQINMGQNFAQVTWRLTIFSHFSVNNFGCSQPYPRCCCCCFSHSAHWLPTRKKLLYTVAKPARGLLNREKKKKKKSGSAPPPPPPARAARSEKK